MLTREQFERTRQLALRLAGIELFERHQDVLDRRSHRLGIHDGRMFDALLKAAEAGEASAGQQFIGLLTTNFSGFFRHPRHFELAAEHALWAVHRRGSSRLWSAAAASGEEPYSLAMSLIEVFQRNDPPITILATDIDESALAVARNDEYDMTALTALSSEQRNRFFTETTGTKKWQRLPTVQQLVDFRPLNLIDPVWRIEGQFDVIFCRNVLMYLEADCRYSVLERLASLLAPDGLLLLDPTEHLGRAGHLFLPRPGGVHSLRRKSNGAEAGHPKPTRIKI